MITGKYRKCMNTLNFTINPCSERDKKTTKREKERGESERRKRQGQTETETDRH